MTLESDSIPALQKHTHSSSLREFTRDEPGNDPRKGATKEKRERESMVLAAAVAITAVGKIRGSATTEKDKEMRGQGRGGGGLVEVGGKWHVAGPREGETREEVGNLDPGMNDPLPLGARGVPLSRRPSPPSTTLARPFHPLFQSMRRRLRRDPFPLSLPFHPFLLPLCWAHHPLLPPFFLAL